MGGVFWQLAHSRLNLRACMADRDSFKVIVRLLSTILAAISTIFLRTDVA